MADEPITEPVAPETGAEQALPVESEPVAADAPSHDEPSDDSEGGDAPVPETDDKLQSFAKGQGIDNISELSERELKLLKVARDNQAEFQRNRQKATELEKTMGDMSNQSAEQVAQATGQDPEVLKRLQNVEVKEAIRDFWDEHPDAKPLQAEMAKIAVESGLYGSPEAILKASYALALANNPDIAKSKGKKEALSELAHKQQAAVPTGNATTSGTPKRKSPKDMSIEELEKTYGFVKR